MTARRFAAAFASLIYLVTASVSAYALDASPHSQWDPICTLRSGPAPGDPVGLKTPAPVPEYLFPYFLKPTTSDFDRASLSHALRVEVKQIVADLPADERGNARWMKYGSDVIVFEVTQSQLCEGHGMLMSPVINKPGLFVDPTTGQPSTGPPMEAPVNPAHADGGSVR